VTLFLERQNPDAMIDAGSERWQRPRRRRIFDGGDLRLVELLADVLH